MKKLSFLLLCAVSIIMVACVNPEKEGARIANELIEAQNSYQDARIAIYDTFIKNFDPMNYVSRASARESITEELNIAQEAYAAKVKFINAEHDKFIEQFANNDEKRSRFEATYLATLENMEIPDDDTELELYNSCDNLILQIVPTFPTSSQIAKDLVGRKFRESNADGYFPDVEWSIKESDKVDIEILGCEDKTGSCTFKTKVTINQSNGACWHADLNVGYVLGEGDGWVFHTLSCEKMMPEIIDSVKGTISDEIENTEDERRFLIIRNNNSQKLVVGGATNNGADDTWTKFGVFINPQDSVCIESTEARTILEYRIDFAEVG